MGAEEEDYYLSLTGPIVLFHTILFLFDLCQSRFEFLSFFGNGTAGILLGKFDHPLRFIIVACEDNEPRHRHHRGKGLHTCCLIERFLKGLALMIAKPRQGTTDEAEGFTLPDRRFFSK